MWAPTLLAAPLVCQATGYWIFSLPRQTRTIQQTESWPSVEATRQSGKLEGGYEGRAVQPAFILSSKLDGGYYAGRFALIPGRRASREEFVDALLKKMNGRKLLVRYGPLRPEIWLISDEFIEDCEVGQERGGNALPALYPKD